MNLRAFWGKAKSVGQRHGLPVLAALLYEAFIRSYGNRIFRKFASFFIRRSHARRKFAFILGCYNSGTTLVKQCVCAHPLVSTTPVETPFLSSISTYQETGWGRALYGNVARIEADRKAGRPFERETYLRELSPWMRKPVFIDKSVPNSVRVPGLANAFPDAKFVYVYRKPAGVIRGIRKRSRPEADAGLIFSGEPYSDAFLYQQWKYFNQCIVEDADRFPGRIHFCSYERFLASPVEELTRIYEFLGLPMPEISHNEAGLRVGTTEIGFHNQSVGDMRGGGNFSDDIARYEAEYEAART